MLKDNTSNYFTNQAKYSGKKYSNNILPCFPLKKNLSVVTNDHCKQADQNILKIFWTLNILLCMDKAKVFCTLKILQCVFWPPCCVQYSEYRLFWLPSGSSGKHSEYRIFWPPSSVKYSEHSILTFVQCKILWVQTILTSIQCKIFRVQNILASM